MAETVVINIEARFIDKTKGVDAVQKKLDKLIATSKKLGTMQAPKVRLKTDSNAFTKKMAQAEKRAKKFGKARVETRLAVRDQASPKLLQAEQRAKKLSNTHAEPRLTVRDQASPFIERAITNANTFSRGKYHAFMAVEDHGAQRIIEQMRSKLKGLTGKAWSTTLKLKDMATGPLKKVMRLAKSPILAAGAGISIGAGIGSTVKTYAGFEAQMSQVKALSGATQEEFTKLTAKAKEMGASTKFTAQESAEAFNYMGMAGWKSADMLSGIEGVLNLAAASGESLGTTSDIVTDALTAFNMKASDATHFSDVLATAASNANTTVSGMGETFKYVGSMAGALGYSVEDVALATGLMANAGIKGSMAGTSLNAMLTRLSTNTSGAADAIRGLGVEFYNSDGTARDLSAVFGELRTATAKMSAEEKSSLANTVAGMEAQKGLLAILNASEADYRKLSMAIENADGASKRMADTMQDNLAGKFTLFKSALDGVKISLGERVEPYLVSALDWLTKKMPDVEAALMHGMDRIDRFTKQTKDKIAEFTGTQEWNSADLFGKMHIAWNELVADPFAQWWDGGGKTKLAAKASQLGESIGSGLSGGLLTLLGIDIGTGIDEGAAIGKSFAKGFLSGFDTGAVMKALTEALGGMVKNAGKLLTGDGDLSSVLSAAAIAKIASPLLEVAKLGKSLFGGSRGGIGLGGSNGAGWASTIFSSMAGFGFKGRGFKRSMPEFNLSGAGNVGSKAAASAGLLSGAAPAAGVAAGSLAGALGGIAAGATVLSGFRDMHKAAKADNAYDRKYNAVKSGSKLGGTGIGAAIGTAILPGVGTLVGAGIGGIAGWLTSGKLADHFVGTADAAKKYSKVSTEAARRTEELKQKQEALAKGSLEQHFGKVTLNADEMSTAIKNVLGTGRMEAIDQTTAAITQMKSAYTSLQESEAALKKTTWMAGMKNGSKMATEEVEGLKAATKSYADSAKQYLSDSQYAATQSVQLLMGNSKASKALVDSTNQYYGETESKLGKLNGKLKSVMDEALSDGKIDMDAEMPKIEEKRGKITELTSKLAKEDFQADLNILKAKSGAGDLSVESFGQLMTGSQEAAEKAAEGYWDAFGQASVGKSDKEIKTLQKGLYNQLSDLQLDVGNLGLDTMRNQYSKELGFLGDDIGSMLQEHTGPEIYNAVQSMSETNRAAIGQFVEQLAPTTEQIQGLADNYKALGAEVPAAITEYLNSASFYEALSQGPQSINSWLQKQEFEGNPTVKMDPNVQMTDLNGDGVISQVEATLSGQTLTPELLANPSIVTEGADSSGVLAQLEAGMNGQTISPAISVNPITSMTSGSSTPFADLTSKIQGSLAGQTVRPNIGVKPIYNLGSKFNPQESGAVNPSYNANTNVAVNAKYNPNKYNVYQGINRSYSASTTVNVAVKYNAIPGSFNPPKPDGAFRGGIFGGGSVRGYSNGGIVAGGGQLINVAEEGTPEMVIPLSRKRRQRGMELWEKAGRYLGVQGYARGGVAGSEEPISIPAISGDSGGVNLHVGGINLTVPVKGGANVVQAVEENLSKISDQVAGELLAAIRSQYANLPITG